MHCKKKYLVYIEYSSIFEIFRNMFSQHDTLQNWFVRFTTLHAYYEVQLFHNCTCSLGSNGDVRRLIIILWCFLFPTCGLVFNHHEIIWIQFRNHCDHLLNCFFLYVACCLLLCQPVVSTIHDKGIYKNSIVRTEICVVHMYVEISNMLHVITLVHSLYINVAEEDINL